MCNHPRGNALALLFLLLPVTTGCHGWRTPEGPVPELVAAQAGEPVRISLVDGRMVRVDSAGVGSDSLFAWRRPTRSMAPVREAYPLDSVRSVQVRQYQKGRTALLITGLVLGGGIGILAATGGFDIGPDCIPLFGSCPL